MEGGIIPHSCLFKEHTGIFRRLPAAMALCRSAQTSNTCRSKRHPSSAAEMLCEPLLRHWPRAGPPEQTMALSCSLQPALEEILECERAGTPAPTAPPLPLPSWTEPAFQSKRKLLRRLRLWGPLTFPFVGMHKQER